VLRGLNGTIFAYGQTGTGKTHTMGLLDLGNPGDADRGIVPRALQRVFTDSSGDAAPVRRRRVTMSFLQIYCEQIYDLLAPEPPPALVRESEAFRATPRKAQDECLQVREHPGCGFYVQGLREYVVHDIHEAEALVAFGLRHRALAPTLMNATSSRSHTVLTATVDFDLDDDDSTSRSDAPSESTSLKAGHNSVHINLKGAKLLLVDLAGSERVRRTESQGKRLAEARAINASLAALGNVIAALADAGPGKHVPFRDSKLTRLLQDSLGGECRTALIATLGPSRGSVNESASTLAFADRCATVRIALQPLKPMPRSLGDLVAEVSDLRRKLALQEADARAAAARHAAYVSGLSLHNWDDAFCNGDISQDGNIFLDSARRVHASASALDAFSAAFKAGGLADAAAAWEAALEQLQGARDASPAANGLRAAVDALDAAVRIAVEAVVGGLPAESPSDVESWSHVLEHLVATNAKLRQQLKHAHKLHPDARVQPTPWRNERRAVEAILALDGTTDVFSADALSRSADDGAADDRAPDARHLARRPTALQQLTAQQQPAARRAGTDAHEDARPLSTDGDGQAASGRSAAPSDDDEYDALDEVDGCVDGPAADDFSKYSQLEESRAAVDDFSEYSQLDNPARAPPLAKLLRDARHARPPPPPRRDPGPERVEDDMFSYVDTL